MHTRLIFESGTVFTGKIFAYTEDKIGEAVFNTAMTGYQEIVTDPSYHGQMVVMTYPLIGSYGINDEDQESDGLYLEALLCKEYIDFPSNWRSKKTLKTYLEEHNIMGVEGLDTRALTRFIRENGAQRCILTTSDKPLDALIRRIKQAPNMVGSNLAYKVTTQSKYVWPADKQANYKIAVIDCGVKHNILRLLAREGCECHIFPATTTSSDLEGSAFDGLFLSNGPGDPEPVEAVVKLVKEQLGKLPIFGICLGHQILGLALGGKTYKLKFGHHGANHPVKNLISGHVEITSQNHGFCVDIDSLNKDDIEITHVNLNDNTVEGIRHKRYPAFSIQYHPEAAPGPHDSNYLFKDFISLIQNTKRKT